MFANKEKEKIGSPDETCKFLQNDEAMTVWEVRA